MITRWIVVTLIHNSRMARATRPRKYGNSVIIRLLPFRYLDHKPPGRTRGRFAVRPARAPAPGPPHPSGRDLTALGRGLRTPTAHRSWKSWGLVEQEYGKIFLDGSGGSQKGVSVTSQCGHHRGSEVHPVCALTTISSGALIPRVR